MNTQKFGRTMTTRVYASLLVPALALLCISCQTDPRWINQGDEFSGATVISSEMLGNPRLSAGATMFRYPKKIVDDLVKNATPTDREIPSHAVVAVILQDFGRPSKDETVIILPQCYPSSNKLCIPQGIVVAGGARFLRCECFPPVEPPKTPCGLTLTKTGLKYSGIGSLHECKVFYKSGPQKPYGVLFASCQMPEPPVAGCSKLGSMTKFAAKFDNDTAGNPPFTMKSFGPPPAAMSIESDPDKIQVVNSLVLNSKVVRMRVGRAKYSVITCVLGDGPHTSGVLYFKFKAQGVVIPKNGWGG